ncbi:extracellular solute-binding protein [Allokutzneria sp. A3M-2-11 16]|uniref:extracellular solute-binding protein n=1 Tax=Allokutzneria sp. A3M-2-11 16 TaxID=2962043 RepID=UPI0020B642EB|nr:extracellular solute-binding protein [Allokutzneria sp. A3M-2-11 16]MCP3801960.1 extracellular solute-binding protein [Allokutzneria sp. A3M-2-11 16]
MRHAPRTVRRRSLLRSAVAGAAGFGLLGLGGSGCSAGTGLAGRPLQMWHLFQGADGTVMMSMLDAVRPAVGVPVQATCLEWGAPYYTKLGMASVGGRPPDLGIMHASRLSGYAPGGLLRPFDHSLLAEFGMTEDRFAPALWRRCLYEGEVYALPLDTHPFIMFVNLDVAERAGLLGTDGALVPITSREQFAHAGRRLAEVTGGTGIGFGFRLDSAQCWRLFWGLYGQTGGEYRFSGSTAEWDMDRAVEVIAFCRSLFDNRIVSRSSNYEAAISGFSTGRTGMLLGGEWELPALAKEIPRLGALPIPTMFGAAASYADSHVFVLPRRPDTVTERLRATHALAAGLVGEGLTWAQGGHIPSYLPIVASPEYARLRPQSSYASAADHVFLDPPLWFTGPGSEFQKQMSARLERGFLGELSPEETARAMLRVVEDLLRLPNPA